MGASPFGRHVATPVEPIGGISHSLQVGVGACVVDYPMRSRGSDLTNPRRCPRAASEPRVLCYPKSLVGAPERRVMHVADATSDPVEIGILRSTTVFLREPRFC